MKKVFLFLAVSALTFSATSCEKDDDKEGNPGSMGTLTFTIDGTSKTFSNVMAENTPDVGLTVIAFNGTPTAMTEDVSFVIKPDAIGKDAVEIDFMYNANGTGYSASETFELNVSDNSTSSKILKGTFSGTLEEFDGEGADKAITNGTFDIQYK